MGPSELLLTLLSAVDDEARVEPLSEAAAEFVGRVSRPGAFVLPTHAVFNADGDTLGRGLSEDEAIADAIASRLIRHKQMLEEVRKAVRAYREARVARVALEQVGG